MRRTSLLLFMLLLAVGCGSSPSGDDANVAAGAGVATNPSGNPRNDQEAATASAMRQQGDQVNAQRMKDAAAMREAMQRSGGK